jgi:hypothetical protein
MTLTVIHRGKNLPLLRHEAEQRIEAAAAETRSRYATPGKHVIYDRKLKEAERYLAAVAAGNTPATLNGFPYMKREVGKTAPTAVDLANLWIAMNAAWEDVSATIEEISITAKAEARAAGTAEDIASIAGTAAAALDAIGEKPPQRPNKPRR